MDMVKISARKHRSLSKRIKKLRFKNMMKHLDQKEISEEIEQWEKEEMKKSVIKQNGNVGEINKIK